MAVEATVAAAAISAAVYAFKEFSAQSNSAGMGIAQFNARTGQSEQALQRWQYLMRQSGVSTEETTGNLEGLQKAMTQLSIGKPPEGFQAVNNILASNGGFDRSRIKDTEYVLERLRKYAQLTKDNPAIANHVLESFGLSGNFIGGLRTSTVDINKVPRASLYSDKEVTSLSKMSVAWSNLGDKVQKAIGRLNIKFGPSLLKDLTLITDKMLILVNAVGTLAEKLHVLEGVAKVVSGLSLLTGAATDVADDLSGKNKQNRILPESGTVTNLFKDLMVNGLGSFTGGTTNQVTVNSSVTVSGAGHAADIGLQIGTHIKQEINKAFRQTPQGKPG